MNSASQVPFVDGEAWYCLKSLPKREHIAASHLRQFPDIAAVFCPRIRFKRATARGAVWFTEAMFPGYLFARFDLPAIHRKVRYAQGVREIVHFGKRFATIDDIVIEQLQAQSGESELVVISQPIAPGDSVQVVDGALKGLDAVVTRVLPANERVKVLLEFLGRTVEAELKQPAVLAKMSHPLAA